MSYKGQLGDRPASAVKKWLKRAYNKWLRRKAKLDPDQPKRREYRGYD